MSVRSVADDRGEIVVGICSADMFIGGTCAFAARRRPDRELYR
ncbi:hypothetical protein ACCD06_02410 [Azospirillum sp. CT11-132]